MRTIASLVGIMLVLGLCASVRAEPEPEGAGTVIGTVVGADGKPAVDCVVTLQQNAQKMRDAIQTTTDADGKFKFEKVPEGDYNLNVRTRDAKGKAIRSLSVTADHTRDVGTLTLKMK